MIQPLFSYEYERYLASFTAHKLTPAQYYISLVEQLTDNQAARDGGPARGTRFTYCPGGALCYRLDQLSKAGDFQLGNGVVYGPFPDRATATGVMRAWRFGAEAHRYGPVDNHYEMSALPFVDACRVMEAVDVNNLPTVASVTTKPNRKVSELIEMTPGNQAIVAHVGEVMSVLPWVKIEIPSPRTLLRSRVALFLSLKASRPFDPAGVEQHLAWKLFWCLFDVSQHYSFVAQHTRRVNDGSYHGSILDFVDQTGGPLAVAKAYAFACWLYFKYPELPQLMPAGAVSEDQARIIFKLPDFATEAADGPEPTCLTAPTETLAEPNVVADSTTIKHLSQIIL